MQEQFDVAEAIKFLKNQLHKSHASIATLEARLATCEEQLRFADTNVQAQKLSNVSRVHPKTRRVVFLGRNYFGDNIKYSFLNFAETAAKNDCEAWFLPPDEKQEEAVRAGGLPCFPQDFNKWTSTDIHRALGTSVVVHCDHNHFNKWKDLRFRALLSGAKQIQLWHGISIKEIGLKYIRGGDVLSMNDCEILETSGKFDVFVGTTRSSEMEWRRSFIFDRYEPIGYPRNDVLMRDSTPNDLLNVDMAAYERIKTARQNGRPVYLYAPTFRDNVGPGWFPPPGLMDVLASPLAQKAVILINIHPHEQHTVAELQRKYPDLFLLKPHSDLYPLLRSIDALITDYSSLIWDYLALDRPIVLFRPDHERYQVESRSLFDQKLATLPGPVSYTAPELISALEGVLRGEDNYAATRHNLYKKWFDHLDGKASDRLTKIIIDMLPEVQKASRIA